LLPDARFAPRRGRPRPGDAPASLARRRTVRGTLERSDLALPHRDQRLPERARRASAPGAAERSRSGLRPIDPLPKPTLQPIWLESYPDRLLDELEDPAVRYARRETIELAFLAAIHLLPPRQRAVLLLRDVLEWSSAEVAELLGTTTASVNSALQRARASLGRWKDEGASIDAPTGEERAILDRYLRAFERADVPALARILADEVEMTMPPDAAWFRGRDDPSSGSWGWCRLRSSRRSRRSG
jgi:RNA polymerase sigma factor (sigma-70 family)